MHVEWWLRAPSGNNLWGHCLKKRRKKMWKRSRRSGARDRTGRTVFVHSSIRIAQEDAPTKYICYLLNTFAILASSGIIRKRRSISLSVEMWHMSSILMQGRRLRQGCEVAEVRYRWKPESCVHQLYPLLHSPLSLSLYCPSFLSSFLPLPHFLLFLSPQVFNRHKKN